MQAGRRNLIRILNSDVTKAPPTLRLVFRTAAVVLLISILAVLAYSIWILVVPPVMPDVAFTLWMLLGVGWLLTCLVRERFGGDWWC